MRENLIKKMKNIHPLLRIMLFVLIAAIFYLIIYFPINKLMPLFNLNPYNNDFFSIFAFFIEYSIIPIVLLLSAYISLKWFENKSIKDIGLTFNKNAIIEVSIGVFLAFLLMGIIFIIELSLGWIKVIGFAWNYCSPSTYIIFLCKSIILFTSVALSEEIFTRGYVLNELESYKGRTFAIIVSSIIFGLFHLSNAVGTWAFYIVPFSLSLIGVLFAMLFYTKKSLWIPIGFHFSWNIFEYEIFSLTGSGGKSIFFVTELTGPKFWVGLSNSSFGPEVGALGILITSISILVLYMKYKHTIKTSSSLIA